MLEILQFVFSSFWIWLGFVVILMVFFTGTVHIIESFRTTETITTTDD